MPNEETIQKISIADPIQVNVNIPNFEGKPGRDGADGRDGDDAYRIAVRNGFLGTEKEWLATLQGTSASAPLSRQALLKNNIWCENDSADSILQALINNWGKPMPCTDFKPLAVETVMTGQRDVHITGEPHYKIKISGSDEMIEIGSDGFATLTLPQPLDIDDYNVEYYNYGNTKVSDFVIQGTQIPDGVGESYEHDGIKYNLVNENLLVNVAGFSGEFVESPIFLGKWQPKQVKKVFVQVIKPTTLSVNSSKAFATMGTIPVLINRPEMLSFANNEVFNTPLMLGGADVGPKPTVFTTSKIVWDATSKEYVQGGATVVHL